MNSNTALIMFVVIATFGLATATLAVPLLPQAHATTITHPSQCHLLGPGGPFRADCAQSVPKPPGRPSGID